MTDSTVLSYREAPGIGTQAVDLDKLIVSRLLIQANSGGGKSWAVRQLLEETHGRLQQIVIDPEGEFSTLREKFPYILAAPKDGDVVATPQTAKLLCRRLMELNASAVLDLYELSLPDRSEFVKRFLTELIALPRSLWRPLLVVIDEAHNFAPENGKGESVATGAVIDLVTKGRKRGYCVALATQRIAKLNKDAAAELLNKLVGRTGFDIDVRRAGDDLGFDKFERQALKTLKPGEWFTYGPAISHTVTRIRTGRVVTTHPEPAKIGTEVSRPLIPAPAAVAALVEQLGDLPKQADEEARTIEQLQSRVRQLERELRAKPIPAVAGPSPAEVRQWQARIEQAERGRSEAQARVTTICDRLADVVSGLQELRVDTIHAEVVAMNRVPVTNGNGASLGPPVSRTATVRIVDDPETGQAPKPELVRQWADAIAPETGQAPKAATGAHARILGALLLLESFGMAPVDKVVCAIYSNYSLGGTFGNYLGALRSQGMLRYPSPNMVELTDEGRKAAPAAPAFHSLAEFHRFVINKAGGALGRILEVVLNRWPREISREALAEATNYSIGGTFGNYVGRLRTLGFVTYPETGTVRAAPFLFPAGLS